MKTKETGAKYSAIVGIGEKLAKLERETGKKYLRLNRGIPAVTNIDLTEVIPLIDFNSPEIQVYPANSGHFKLKTAINKYYFQNKTTADNIFVTAGGMNALDLIFKTLDFEKLILPEFYWGAYLNIAKINKINTSFYLSFDELREKKEEIKDSVILICDPNNPIGNKYDDKMLLELVEELNYNGTTIIWDSPYRKLFYEEDDDFYSRLIKYKNVIIAESFSKSLGLSGQRIGFIHSTNQDFNTNFNINLLYATNGINGFAQVLVEKLLSSPQGQKASKAFRQQTVDEMQENISYLKKKGLLADEFYQSSTPVGIFTVVNKSEEELLKYNIGSVGLYYFTQINKELGKKYARLCISVPHVELKSYFANVE
jgi:aspartate/methionine/tyrosine aminotransferase